MSTCFKSYILIFFSFISVYAQPMQIVTEIATAGAFLGGGMGTHSIQSNPAILGIQSGEILEKTIIDTFSISYYVKLAESKNKKELEELKNKLNRDGFERDYTIEKKDSLFFLSTNGFKDSFSAFNFSSNLPISVPLKTIYTDTTWETIERPKIYYSIQILATPYKDTLNAFQRRVKKKLQGFHTNVVFKDSLFKYYVGLFDSEEKAIMLKNNPTIQTIDNKAFVINSYNKVPDDFAPTFSLTFPIRFTFNFQNNSLNTNWINEYVGADMIEDPLIKNDLINSIPSSGISSSLWLNSGTLDMTYLNYGLSLLNINAYYNVNVPKELTEVIFDGIRFNDPQDISNFDTRGLIYNESTFSVGRKLDLEQLPFPTYIGLGFKYLNGYFSFTEKYEGIITTKEDSVTIFSDLNTIYTVPTQMATGFGIDLGFYGYINDRISAQISFMGLGSYLESKHGTNWQSINSIKLASSDFTKILDYNDTQKDSIAKTFSILDTTKNIDNISIEIPARFNIAGSYIYSSNIHIKGAIQYLAQTDFIGKVPPQFSLGAEFFPEKTYSLLGGFSLGGMNKSNIGLGIELRIKTFCFNIALSQSGGIFNSANGISLSSELRFSN